MNVQAINSVSSLNFEGKSKKSQQKKSENNYPQMDSPASKSAAKSMRNLLTGLMILGASATGGSMMTSCAKAEAFAEAKSKIEVTVIGHDCKHDHTIIHDTIHHRDTIIETIIKPVNVKEYPVHLGDSLLAQGINIGIPLEGPKPGDDVVFVGSKAFNRYDMKLYETHVDSIGTNKRQLSLVTKITDLYDSENPQTSWMKTNITDVPGKGIKLDRYVCDNPTEPNDHEQYMWNYAGYEVRSNGGRGNKPGVNTVYDNTGSLVWKGEYTNKGCEAGSFMFGTLVYDENGNPYLDDEGNPETALYDFNQAKMWSDKIKWVEVPNPEFGKLD